MLRLAPPAQFPYFQHPSNVTYCIQLSFGQPLWLKDCRSKEKIMANLLWKLTPARSWPTADATVDSCEWVRYHDHLGGTAGHYQVNFTYRAGNGQVNQGEFCHQGVQHIAPYSVGERLSIQY